MSDAPTTRPCEYCGKPLALDAQACDQCGCTVGKKKKKIFGVTEALVILATMVAVIYSAKTERSERREAASAASTSTQVATAPQPEVPQEPEPPAPPETPPPTVTARDIALAYAENTVAADQVYKGRRFRVTGVVRDINTDFMGDPYLTLKGGQNEFMEPQFKFTKDDAQDLAKLRKGHKVTLECTGRGDVIKTPVSGDCRLL